MSKKLIILIGAPGSGKTTDSQMITKKHAEHISNISVGKLVAQEIQKDTYIGKMMKKYVDLGNLIPGEIILDEVFGRIKDSPKDIVLMDGFARELDQMKSLGDTLIHYKEIELVAVIEIKVSREISKKRVLGDDFTKEAEELFEHKMDIYENYILEIEKFYEKENKLMVVNGERELEKVIEDIDEILINKISLF